MKRSKLHQGRSSSDCVPQKKSSTGDVALMEAILRHVETNIGTVSYIYHETRSPTVHVDILRIDPTPGRNFFTLVTTGMSERPMISADEPTEKTFAELVLCLPSGWKVHPQYFVAEKYYWPFRLLKSLARMPHVLHTVLGWGHTIQYDENMSPYDTSVAFSGCILLNPISVPDEFVELEYENRAIEFLSVVPLFPRELVLAREHGSDRLADFLENAGVAELVQIERRPTA